MSALNSGFQPWNSGHDDIILSTAWDYHGRRIATASADQTVRVWEKTLEKNGGEILRLVDSWQAHAGEVTKVCFVSPYSSHICSLATDCHLKIWAEDVQAPLKSGRRYICIFSIKSDSRMPFTSVDFKTIPSGLGGLSTSSLTIPDPLACNLEAEGFRVATGEQYMVVTTQDGLLIVFEAGEPTDISDKPLSVWSEMFRTNLQFLHRRFVAQSSEGAATAASLDQFGAPSSTTPPNNLSSNYASSSTAYTLAAESSFLASFDPSPFPTHTAVGVGLARHSLGLAVVAMNTVFVFRTDNLRKFYLAARLDSGGSPGTARAELLRDVSWAPGNVRGHDLIAAAGKGGWVWVWRLKAEPIVAAPTHVTRRTEWEDRPSRELARDNSSIHDGARPGTGTSKRSADTAILSDGTTPLPPSDFPITRPRTASRSSFRSDGSAGDDDTDLYEPPSSTGLTSIEDRLNGRIKHICDLVAELKHPTPTWSCEWNLLGDLLITTAEDAIVRTWKQAIDGEWLECGSVET